MIQNIKNWFFALVDDYMHARYGKRKSVLFKDHPKEVIEIGAGYGANFRYLKSGTRVIAVEPNSSLRDILKKRAERFGIILEIHHGGAEELLIPDNHVEMVLGSLVLCSVNDPIQVVSEIKRVLKAGGRFAYLEHVKAREGSWVYGIQRMVRKPWKCFFDGCHVTRDTGKLIQNSGFKNVDQQAFNSRTIFVPIIPHISGVAVK
ncbi:MAG: class I SAM-dependent methyltransferase [Gracilimonas sp.]|uniref:class I SAM-dependent methyltransferase n=1 Tax=Gracilimonas sp. TaxID=1974203 RepID=UPI0019B2115E|nr:class I SAM-dependent methyltransferase [Gracilimonas sp.]MBD3616347.1 class I SAM-dependent methyltransferase [Gracilimonas sp.]